MLTKKLLAGFFSFFLALYLVMPATAATEKAQSPAPSTEATAPREQSNINSQYIGNSKSRVFHKQGCRYFNCKTCTTQISSPEDAAAKGYKPCRICIKKG